MKKNIQILLILLLPLLSFSQQQKLLLGLDLGANFTKFKSDSLDFRMGMQPSIGVFGNYKLSDKIYANLLGNYSIRSSFSPKPYLKLINNYIDLNLNLQYEFYEGVYFNAGPMYSNIVGSKITYNSDGSDKQSIDTYNSEISVVLGMGFRVSRNINLEFNYFVPTSKSIVSNFQIGVSIELNNKKIEKPKTFTEIVNEKSKQQISDLKNGVLLVRLHKNQKSIDAMERLGKKAKAEKAKQKQLNKNEKIVDGFVNNFTFCEYRFFYSENSDNVRERKFENIFLNNDLKIDSTITIDTTKQIFIAEFNYLDEDTAKYFSDIVYRNDENGDLIAESTYYTSSSVNFFDLVIKDSVFVQLQSPFPYCTRGPNFMRKGSSDGKEILIKGDKNPFSRRIYKMNNNLYRFHRFIMQ